MNINLEVWVEFPYGFVVRDIFTAHVLMCSRQIFFEIHSL
jgi:hypothetical protein